MSSIIIWYQGLFESYLKVCLCLQEEYNLATTLTVQLFTALKQIPVLHRDTMCQESALFNSYFPSYS